MQLSVCDRGPLPNTHFTYRGTGAERCGPDAAWSMSKAPVLSKRDTRLTIQQILSAARTEFGLKGLEGTRVEDIARRCGKTKQLIYYYYASKEELYGDVVRENFSQALDGLLDEAHVNAAPPEALRELLERIFEQYRQFPEWALFMLDENIHGGAHVIRSEQLRGSVAELLSLLEEILSKGAARGDFRPVDSVDMFFAAALALVTSCFLTGNVTSRYLAIDITGSEGQTRWRDYAINLLLSSLRREAQA